MEDGMATMFPNGIRTLIVDDDAKFLNSATKLLDYLNFEVVVCSTVDHALKSLTGGGLHGFDVILVHAAKAAAAGFDFRAIIEANLLIPVIYFLPQDHQVTGDEADELLRALQVGTYVIKKPIDANEVRSLLWKVIAFRKREMETKARRGGAGAADCGKVVKEGGKKRKCSGSNPGGSEAAGGLHPAAKGKEKDNVASLQQPAQEQKHHGRGEKAQKNDSGEAFKHLQLQPNKAMINGPRHVFRTLGNNSITFSNNMKPAAAPTMAADAATSATYEPQFSQVLGNQQLSDVHPLLMFESFPYQGPSSPAAAGGLFSGGMAGGGTNGGASVAVATADAAAYDDDVSLSFLQPSMVPQPFFAGAIDKATMEWLLSDDFDDCVRGSSPLVAPNNHVPGMASNVAPSVAPSDLVATPNNGGNTNAASFVAAPHQDFDAAPNIGDQLAGDNNIHGSLMGSEQGQGAAVVMDGDDAMLPSDEYEDNTSFPHDALLDLHGPLTEFDDIVNVDAMLGSLTGGDVATADDDDASLIAGEESGSDMDGLGNLDGLQIPYDLLESFLIPNHKNWNNVGRE